MERPERYHDHPPAELPRLSPAEIRAFEDQARTVEDVLDDLRRTNPHLAEEILRLAEHYGKVHGDKDGPDPDMKRALTEGALLMYGFLQTTSEVRNLETAWRLSGDAFGADPPPSA